MFIVYSTDKDMSRVLAINIDILLFFVYNDSEVDYMENKIGQLVKNKREELKLSLREFGAMCRMSHTHIDSIEKGFDARTGKPVNLTSATISKLSAVLGMSESELMGTDKTQAATKQQLKVALFDDPNAPDSLLNEVIRYARYIKGEK